MRIVLLTMAILAGPDTVAPPPADPLTVEIETGDVDRFAALFERAGGQVTAELIQREYLDRGSYGVHIFTPNRIRNAETLARKVAAEPDVYEKAIRSCLPVAKSTTAELRSTYLALAGLFPDLPLPRIYLVIGADNSGGTAGPGAQVLGLETLCRVAGTPDKLRDIIRGFYAHETVHVFQKDHAQANAGGILLNSVLKEGAADFIAALVTGRPMDPERSAWVAAREAELWRQFDADLALTRHVSWETLKVGTREADAVYRWVANYGRPPKGWPGEAGYAMGERIWQRWYDKQPDKHVALRMMLSLADPIGVLNTGRFVADGKSDGPP